MSPRPAVSTNTVNAWAAEANPIYRIRGGTGCVSRVTVLTDSALAEGSLRLDAGASGLRFSATEGAPWADAQAMRNDTPPASVGASRDFWLGASAGDSHTLEYSLRTPHGAACLSTNLAIEAIVAKFATNVYYAAHGDTGGILVGLTSASYDAAGFTLKLDGAACADEIGDSERVAEGGTISVALRQAGHPISTISSPANRPKAARASGAAPSTSAL